ncbi:hypothetical protein [Streptomyces sp. NPDC047070]|uniref:hypothetical protein n=1 Tax=Streptomyces sp. NPDC047070 TaxID=3154923 RepID=UPI0034548B12
MRPYSRPAHRPYPRAVKALHQVERGRVAKCPRCEHAVAAHARDEQGQRVCTRGKGSVACRECAHTQALRSEPVRAMFLLGEGLALAPRASSWEPLVLSPWRRPVLGV